MARLDFPDYLGHLQSESRRFRDVLSTCDPMARVPGCPDWDAADLLWHLAEVQWFWGNTVRTRPAAAEKAADGPQRPKTYNGLLAAFDDYSAALVAELEQARPDEEAWTWSDEQTVGFTFRRQAHEALIHRLDAEQVAGTLTPLDPALCADGVEEVLAVMYGGCPEWGSFAGLPHYLRLDCTDTGDRVWVQIGDFSGTDPQGVHHEEDDISVVADPGAEADAVVAGEAGVLNAWLWRRADDTGVKVSGDRKIYDHFRQVIHQPIN